MTLFTTTDISTPDGGKGKILVGVQHFDYRADGVSPIIDESSALPDWPTQLIAIDEFALLRQ